MDTYDFTPENINNAPDAHGVYVLLEHGSIIYIGRAAGDGVTICSRLQDHYRGDEGTQHATQYRREVSSNPVLREFELLTEFKRRYGRLPRCNQRIG
jgi:hypothetical protein